MITTIVWYFPLRVGLNVKRKKERTNWAKVRGRQQERESDIVQTRSRAALVVLKATVLQNNAARAGLVPGDENEHCTDGSLAKRVDTAPIKVANDDSMFEACSVNVYVNESVPREHLRAE